jgi:ArsR family transcriptional regulator
MAELDTTSFCAKSLKALADETRLGVMELLLQGPLHVSDMQQRLGVEQSLFSHHLRILREAGLVIAERDGKSVLYHIAPQVGRTQSGRGINLGCCEIAFTSLVQLEP